MSFSVTYVKKENPLDRHLIWMTDEISKCSESEDYVDLIR